MTLKLLIAKVADFANIDFANRNSDAGHFLTLDLVISFILFSDFRARTPSTNKQLPPSKILHTRENEPTPELWNQKKKTENLKKIEEDNNNYHDKTRKKNRQNAWRKKKINPALNHAAIIRKQKKAVRSPPYPNNFEYPNWMIFENFYSNIFFRIFEYLLTYNLDQQ